MEMEKMVIPHQLCNDNFRFVKLGKKAKIPVEKDWQNKTYTHNDAASWLKAGYNYGVLGGYDGLIIIDADTSEMSQLILQNLPKTFTVKTPRCGHHFYYICKGIDKKIVLKKDDKHFGEIISLGSQVVGAGSIHPDTGTRYEVLYDTDIADISCETVHSVLIDYIPFNIKHEDENKDISDIKIVDILAKKNITTRNVKNQLVTGHPVHGSTNNNNFIVEPEKNVWHCFRCNSGGGALMLIAVLDGIIDCSDAKPGVLRGALFNEVLSIAHKEYGYEISHRNNRTDDTQISDAPQLIVAKIKLIPSDTSPVQLAQMLDPILRELAVFSLPQADAILKFTIKEHFSLNSETLKGYEKQIKEYRKALKNTDDKKEQSDEDLIKKLDDKDEYKTVHPAQDYSDGIMNFAVNIKGEFCILTSDKRLFSINNAEEKGFSLMHTDVDTAKFSQEGIKQFIEDNNEVDIVKLHKEIFNYIKRFICFPDESYLHFITLWVMGTYFFMIFRYYPYVWLNAEKNSGKTLLMEILEPIVFNGELITNPTEAVIFRDISNNLRTMLIDEVEQLRKCDKDAHASIISILNTGFNKAGKVKRCEKTGKGPQVLKSFNSYSPKIFAGINEIDDALQSRTIRIPLLRKKNSEKVERYKTSKEILELQKQIRDGLYTFALTHAEDIAEYYNNEDKNGIECADHLKNRELDIWEPIFLIANFVDAEAGNTELTDIMTKLSKESVQARQADSVAQNDTHKLLIIFKGIREEIFPIKTDGELQIYDAKEVFEYFKKTEEYDWMEKPNSLTIKLKKINVKSEQHRTEGEKTRVYIINIPAFEDLCERYSI